MQNNIPQLTTILTDGMVVIKNGINAGDIRINRRPRKIVSKVKNGTDKAKKVLRIEKSLDQMLAQGAIWELSEKSFRDFDKNYIIGENGKRLRGYQIRKMKKAGLLPA